MKSLMKSLKIHVKESIFKESIFNDVEDIVNDDTALFEQFLKDNYQIDGTYIIKNSVIDVMGDVRVKNKNIESLTNGLFQFGKVDGGFTCSGCENLKSLKGAPEKVGGDFNCVACDKLTTLEGSPEEVSRDFYCNNCINLTSLKGAPKKIGGGFSCCFCSKLTSLEGAPEKVKDIFWCSNCTNLKSLKGAPKKVGGYFWCDDCKNLMITDQDRKKYKIKG